MSSEANKPEPFGYFRALPYGWEDCAETDEGARALYDEDAISTQAARIAELEAEVDRLRGAITGFCNEHRWAVDAWKNTTHTKPLFDIDRAIKAAKEEK